MEITIKNIKTPKGTLVVGLYSSASNFDNADVDPQYPKKIRVDQAVKVIIYDNLPTGKYAIKTYHDANENQKFDKSVIGLPKEQYGFSNNEMGVMGPPYFSQCAFLVQGKTQHTIILR